MLFIDPCSATVSPPSDPFFFVFQSATIGPPEQPSDLFLLLQFISSIPLIPSMKARFIESIPFFFEHLNPGRPRTLRAQRWRAKTCDMCQCTGDARH